MNIVRYFIFLFMIFNCGIVFSQQDQSIKVNQTLSGDQAPKKSGQKNKETVTNSKTEMREFGVKKIIINRNPFSKRDRKKDGSQDRKGGSTESEVERLKRRIMELEEKARFQSNLIDRRMKKRELATGLATVTLGYRNEVSTLKDRKGKDNSREKQSYTGKFLLAPGYFFELGDVRIVGWKGESSSIQWNPIFFDAKGENGGVDPANTNDPTDSEGGAGKERKKPARPSTMSRVLDDKQKEDQKKQDLTGKDGIGNNQRFTDSLLQMGQENGIERFLTTSGSIFIFSNPPGKSNAQRMNLLTRSNVPLPGQNCEGPGVNVQLQQVEELIYQQPSYPWRVHYFLKDNEIHQVAEFGNFTNYPWPTCTDVELIDFDAIGPMPVKNKICFQLNSELKANRTAMQVIQPNSPLRVCKKDVVWNYRVDENDAPKKEIKVSSPSERYFPPGSFREFCSGQRVALWNNATYDKERESFQLGLDRSIKIKPRVKDKILPYGKIVSRIEGVFSIQKIRETKFEILHDKEDGLIFIVKESDPKKWKEPKNGIWKFRKNLLVAKFDIGSIPKEFSLHERSTEQGHENLNFSEDFQKLKDYLEANEANGVEVTCFQKDLKELVKLKNEVKSAESSKESLNELLKSYQEKYSGIQIDSSEEIGSLNREVLKNIFEKMRRIRLEIASLEKIIKMNSALIDSLLYTR